MMFISEPEKRDQIMAIKQEIEEGRYSLTGDDKLV